MKILVLSTKEKGGGAEAVALRLAKAYQTAGHEVRAGVRECHSDDPIVREIPHEAQRRRNPWKKALLGISQGLERYEDRIKGAWRVGHFASDMAEPMRTLARERGHEDFYYPATDEFIANYKPDVIHAHNLHGGYFDLRCLPDISQQIPFFLTLHDMWSFTGHCGYSISCDRWRDACGNCPDLTLYPKVKRDGTAYNLQRKSEIYANSRLFVASPSLWLKNCAEASVLQQGIESIRHLPYGIDLDIYQPDEQPRVRAELNLPQNAAILMFSGAKFTRNPFKDVGTLLRTVDRLAERRPSQDIIFLALGDDAPPKVLSEAVRVMYVPYQNDPHQVAKYYQAADIYLHAARADNFPLAVLEALACGLPVIATDVGGVGEAIQVGETGFLVTQGDDAAMTEVIWSLLTDENRCRAMGQAAAEDAKQHFDQHREAATYLEWFQKILDGHQ